MGHLVPACWNLLHSEEMLQECVEIGDRFPPASRSSCSRNDRNSLSPANIFLVVIMFVSCGKAPALPQAATGDGPWRWLPWCREPVPSHRFSVFYLLFADTWTSRLDATRSLLCTAHLFLLEVGKKKPVAFVAAGGGSPEGHRPGPHRAEEGVLPTSWLPAG